MFLFQTHLTSIFLTLIPFSLRTSPKLILVSAEVYIHSMFFFVLNTSQDSPTSSGFRFSTLALESQSKLGIVGNAQLPIEWVRKQTIATVHLAPHGRSSAQR